MNTHKKTTIEFQDLEDLHFHQIDLIRILQCGLNSGLRLDAGYYVLNLIEQIANKSYEIGSQALDNNSSLKTVA